MFQNPGRQLGVPEGCYLGLMDLREQERREIRLLGIWLDSNLSFKHHIDMTSKKVSYINWALFKLKMLNVPRFVILRSYKALLLPYLFFGLSCWGFAAGSHFQRLVVLQNNAIRNIYGLRSRDSTLEVMQKNMLFPLNLLVQRQAYRLIRRLAGDLKPIFPDHFNNTTLHSSRRTDHMSFFVPGPTRRVRQRSLFYEGVKSYNLLPYTLRDAQTNKTFQTGLKLFMSERLKNARSTAAGERWTE